LTFTKGEGPTWSGPGDRPATRRIDGMGLLTIGEFARASGLSPKALRLYDDLGLLEPAVVDQQSGYRRYRPGQLAHAQLVAWLRRLGMPLARIKLVTSVSGADAARDVADYWRQVEADTSLRRQLASTLVDHLSRKDQAMTDTPTPLLLRYAARSDRGLVRDVNQDAVHSDGYLVAVADGFGANGDCASAIALEALLEHRATTGDVLNALQNAALRADEAVREVAAADSGTTLTALAWSGSELAFVHIGDSRAYLLRHGVLVQLTHDHTVVQGLIDDGTLTAAEAESHPQRATLVRAIHGEQPARPDSFVQDAQAGDRYLLSSDGLHGTLRDEVVHAVLAEQQNPQDAVDELIRHVHTAGAPDNVACAVADIVEPVSRRK
jgi:serine/threonine protein phosphatase PrpC